MPSAHSHIHVNGNLSRKVSPIVVNQGDKVQITLTNGGSKKMHVTMPHSIDIHAAEVAPSKYYVDVAPGKSETFRFVANHPGVFMYHCATQPVLMHVANGMAGMMVVKPKGLLRAGHDPITTEILPAPPFYYAEEYHQQYLQKNPGGYCGLGGTGVTCPTGLGAA